MPCHSYVLFHYVNAYFVRERYIAGVDRTLVDYLPIQATIKLNLHESRIELTLPIDVRTVTKYGKGVQASSTGREKNERSARVEPQSS